MTTQPHAIASDNHTYINQLSKHEGTEVVLKGWLYNMRSSGKILFPQLRDGTGIVQCVVLKNAFSPELWESLKGLGQESALVIKGTVRVDSRAPSGYEIDVTDAEVLQQVHDYPITPKEHGTEFLMDHRQLWLRSRRQHAVLKVRHTVVQAVRNFSINDGFTLCDTPIFTPAACEGTTTLFEVDYFDGEKSAYLSRNQVSFTTKRRWRRLGKSTALVQLSEQRDQAWMCGIEHIRETIPFPRMLYRIRL